MLNYVILKITPTHLKKMKDFTLNSIIQRLYIQLMRLR